MVTNPRFEGAVLGGGSIWLPKDKHRLVDPGSSWRGHSFTPSYLARIWLGDLLEKSGRKRVGWCKRTLPLLSRKPPLFCIPHAGQMLSVDLKSAYWSIYHRLWLDTHYDGEHFGRGVIPLSMLGQSTAVDKPLRNSVIGIIRAQNIRKIIGGRIVTVPTHNKFLAPELWGFLADLLQAIAARAIELGALYWHTDGGVFPRAAQAGCERWCNEMAAVGLTPLVKGYGRGRILSPGNWYIEDDRHGIGTREHAYSNLAPAGTAWNWWTYVYRQYELGRYTLAIPTYRGSTMESFKRQPSTLLDAIEAAGVWLKVDAIHHLAAEQWTVYTPVGYARVVLDDEDLINLRSAIPSGVPLYLHSTQYGFHVRGEAREDCDWTVCADGHYVATHAPVAPF